MRGLAAIAERYGDGVLRLTVWQNVLISGIAVEQAEAVRRELEALGLQWQAGAVRSGLVACTGNAGCRFAAADTKRHALQIADHVDARLRLEGTVNVHLTGCPHSCAQHFIGDVGFLGTSVEVGDDFVEGYHVYVGGGYGEQQEIGREIYRSVPASEAPQVTERMLAAYLRERRDPDESFLDFCRRHSTEQLRALFELEAVPA